MTRFAPRRICLAAAAFAFALTGAAQAFTFQDGDGAGSNRSGFKDLDIPKVPNNAPESRFGGNGDRSTTQFGNTTLQFGTSRPGMGQQYNPSNMFNPYYRDGR